MTKTQQKPPLWTNSDGGFFVSNQLISRKTHGYELYAIQGDSL